MKPYDLLLQQFSPRMGQSLSMKRNSKQSHPVSFYNQAAKLCVHSAKQNRQENAQTP